MMRAMSRGDLLTQRVPRNNVDPKDLLKVLDPIFFDLSHIIQHCGVKSTRPERHVRRSSLWWLLASCTLSSQG